MKKIATFLTAIVIMSMNANAQQRDIQLPAPDKNVSMTLFEALQNRHSEREFGDREVSDTTLSQLLWAACGINRPDGKLTAPSAINRQDVRVYAVRKDGAYLYEPKENKLRQVSDKDLRLAAAGRQTEMADAPIILVLASDQSVFGDLGVPKEVLASFSNLDAGYVSQNICLAAEALGLKTVPRMTMDQDALRKELALPDSEVLVVNNPIGY